MHTAFWQSVVPMPDPVRGRHTTQDSQLAVPAPDPGSLLRLREPGSGAPETGNQRQETKMTDPFSDPAVLPTTRPTVGGLRGRLALFKPTSTKMVPAYGRPGEMVEQLTVDITVVDGNGPVPVVKGNPPRPTGQTLDGHFWPGVWISNEVIVAQLQGALKSGGMVIGTIDTKTPGTDPGKGNAWGIAPATEEQKQIARNFLAGQMVSAASVPAPAPQPVAQAAPVFSLTGTGPGSKPFQGENPFA
jgi:hypothetical protein